MKLDYQKLGSLAIALIGFYTIFSVIVASGATFMIFVLSIFTGDLRDFGYAILTLIPQFLVPLFFGIILIRKSAKLSGWLLSRVEIQREEEVEGLGIEDVSFLLFTLLGLYMLTMTVLPVLQLFAAWFTVMARETSIYGVAPDTFWNGRLPEIVSHAAAIGFSAFVFFRGASVSRFVLSLRKR